MSYEPAPLDPEVEEFSYSPAFRLICILCTLALSVFAILFVALPFIDRRGSATYPMALFGVLLFGILAVFGASILRKLWDRIVIDSEGISYRQRRGGSTTIAWPDIATVTANDVKQRLVLADIGYGKTIKLEYQLEDFSRLRKRVLDHTHALVRERATEMTVFHRSPINTWIFICAPFALAIFWQAGHGAAPLAATLTQFSVLMILGLARAAFDPYRLTIGAAGVEITAFARTRRILFSEISSADAADISGNGNVWAGVVLNLYRDKPVRLFRYSEGSLALHEALNVALARARAPQGANTEGSTSARNASPPVRLTLDVELKDHLSASWLLRAHRRHLWQFDPAAQPSTTRWQRTRRVGRSVVFGLCLGFFHLCAAGFVLVLAANVFGYWPELDRENFHYLSSVTILFGAIWFWLLAAPALQKFRSDSATRKVLRINFPEMLWHPVSMSARVSATRIILAGSGRRYVVPLGAWVTLIDAGSYLILQMGSMLLPLAKPKLSLDSMVALLDWSKSQNIPVQKLPTQKSLAAKDLRRFGGVLLLACLWVGTHIKVQAAPSIFPRAVRLILPDETIFVAGEIVHLQRLRYSLSDNEGLLYDTLDGYISRPEISGTFYVDRNAAPNLARTAEAEFEIERAWHLTIGQIPPDATMEPLPDSGMYVAWEQPSTAEYPGHCGALRANLGTAPMAGGRVSFRDRVYIQACSATMLKGDVKAWMQQAVRSLNHELLMRTRAPA